jgi:dienelactone hydrolase
MMQLADFITLVETARRSLLAGLIISAGACSGGGNNSPSLPERIDMACDATSVPNNGTCRTFGLRLEERATTPFIENGQPVSREVVIYRPLDEGRYPTLVFNHGSTGNGSDPSLFGVTFTSKAIASFFVDRGWMVAFPQRRGRGASDGLYDEGFAADRSGYSCNLDPAIAGAERALDDIVAVTDWLLNRADVDTTRMLIGGTSRGGILSIAFLPRRPDAYLGAVNFVGGWIAEGCGDFMAINRNLFVRGGAFPGTTLWLYGAHDSFYSLAYSHTNFDAYAAAGGLGQFYEFTREPGLNGHFVLNDPDLWASAVEDYLEQLP